LHSLIVRYDSSLVPQSFSLHLETTILTLNDDVLLNLFRLYQLGVADEGEDENGILILDWDRQRWWYKLAQVCRRWRYLILASPSRLDLHLFCTYDVPVADMLAHSPPLPLTICYDDLDSEMPLKTKRAHFSRSVTVITCVVFVFGCQIQVCGSSSWLWMSNS
jgi:hypothetical protein